MSLSEELDGLQVSIELNSSAAVATIRFAGYPAEDAEILKTMEDCCLGVSLREAADHAAIYATHRLVNSGTVPRGNGVVLPGNASPALVRAQRLLRQVYGSRVQGIPASEEDWNFEDRGLSHAWVSQGKGAKASRIRACLAEFCAREAMAPELLAIVDIDKYDRIDVRFAEEVSVQLKPKLLMAFERYLRLQTGERLELFVSEMKDLNRIRRL